MCGQQAFCTEQRRQLHDSPRGNADSRRTIAFQCHLKMLMAIGIHVVAEILADARRAIAAPRRVRSSTTDDGKRASAASRAHRRRDY
jgi:hypothetical protein